MLSRLRNASPRVLNVCVKLFQFCFLAGHSETTVLCYVQSRQLTWHRLGTVLSKTKYLPIGVIDLRSKKEGFANSEDVVPLAGL